jgi:large subunit ribosomal protein L23
MSIAARQERLITVLNGPHMSEKTTTVAEKHNQIVFKVRKDATKREIKQAVELMFEVSVDKVQVVNSKGKVKRHGGTTGRRAAWKKAYVTLAEGSHLDFLGTE